jgi:hypothetical protein
MERAPPMAMTRRHFAYRIDRWDEAGDNIMEQVAGVQDLILARATFELACTRWPGETITLRQGSRVLADSRKTRLASRLLPSRVQNG